MDGVELDNRFHYHPPLTPGKVSAHAEVRLHCRELAANLNEILPESREKSLAVTHLEETLMWSNAAIARHPGPSV